MDTFEVFVWESLTKKITGTLYWSSDVCGFASLNDALEEGYAAHRICTEHLMHRITKIYFNVTDNVKIGQSPVFYILKLEQTNAA